jgi:outer membrane protein assembly factor BamA
LVFAQPHVDEIRIEGNDRTQDKVILREWNLIVEDSMQKIDESEYLLTLENRLYNLNLFNQVNAQFITVRESVVLLIEVVEKWYIWPIPFLEFSDRNFNIWQSLEFGADRTNYGLYLFNYNLFGLNHTAKFSLVEGYHSKYGLEYRIPFLVNDPKLSLQFGYQYKSQDELWHQTTEDRLEFYSNRERGLIKSHTAYFGLGQQMDVYSNLGIQLGYQRTEVDTDAVYNAYGQPFLEQGAHQQELYHITAYWYDDSRDNRFFPMEGRSLSLQATQTFGSMRNLALSMRQAYYGHLSGAGYWGVSLLAVHNTNGERAYLNNRMFGYNRYVRGYENYVIDGQSSGLVKAAYRFNLLDNDFPLSFVPFKNYKLLPVQAVLECFVDAGYVVNNQVVGKNDLPNSSLVGAGIGLNVLAYNDKVFRFEYSMNARSESGWYVHFTKSL